MSSRRQIVLPDPVDQQLRELANSADTPPSTLASQLVQAGVAQAAKDGKVRPLRSTPALVGARGGQRPPWLEPYGGDNQWRRQMWGAIVALHGRYPEQLQALKDKWWTSESTTETLCALAVWRTELDDSGQDPREELAFQTQLADYSHLLRQQGGVPPRHGSQVPHRPSGPTSSRSNQTNQPMRLKYCDTLISGHGAKLDLHAKDQRGWNISRCPTGSKTRADRTGWFPRVSCFLNVPSSRLAPVTVHRQ